jgi:cytochrome c peroxidase
MNGTIQLLVSVMTVAVCIAGCQNDTESEPVVRFTLTQKQELGKLLFFDKNLSAPPGQACSDCHAPETGFSNPVQTLPVSRGVHPDRFGKRNDLTAAYAGHSPEFRYDEETSLYIGGLFWDGRVSTLEEQAKGPFLNVLEMANPDEQAVVDKIRNAAYRPLFETVFGADALNDTEKAYTFIAEAIADYERSPELNRFDSKYDAYLKGTASLSEQEQRGLALFEGKGNCSSCHPSEIGADGFHPLFTDYTYDNLGVPKNPSNPFLYLPADLNPSGTQFVDLGLGGELKKPEQNGKFKVPTLRNVAATAPYLHNGIFLTLRDVIVFYNTRDIGPWPSPEVPDNVNREELGNLGLTEQDVGDIAAFLQTLTDGYFPGERQSDEVPDTDR